MKWFTKSFLKLFQKSTRSIYQSSWMIAPWKSSEIIEKATAMTSSHAGDGSLFLFKYTPSDPKTPPQLRQGGQRSWPFLHSTHEIEKHSPTALFAFILFENFTLPMTTLHPPLTNPTQPNPTTRTLTHSASFFAVQADKRQQRCPLSQHPNSPSERDGKPATGKGRRR